jgi:hypothetical protein
MFEIPLDIKGEQVSIADARKDIANAIYQKGNTIEAKRLAEKIYDSDGNLELNNEEVTLLREISKTCFVLPVQDAIDKQLELNNKE